MAIIIDPDNLAVDTDIVIDTTNLTIEIKTTGAVTNAGATGGVRGQTLYSFLKERWKADNNLFKYPFPMLSITDEQFEFEYGWAPKDDTTRNLIRNAGWAEKASDNSTVKRKYMGIVSIGSIGDTDQPYYRWNTGAKTNFAFPGPINQAVQIFGDATNGNFNYTDGDNFYLYVREQGKTYGASSTIAQSITSLTYKVYPFGLSNATDLKISADDATIASSAPWNQISVEFFDTDQMENIDGSPSAYRIIVTDGSGSASTQQIYEKIQYLLRQNTDIDSGAGTVTGSTADALLSFLGDTLVGANGVFISGLNSNYLNKVDFYDKNGIKHIYPFVAAGTINFGQYAGNGDFKYAMYFASGFGSASAIVVNDKDGNPITGTYAGSPVSFTFAYDTNNQGGRTPATDAAVKLVGIGLGSGQYINIDATLTRSAGQNILLAPALERNYSNPV